MLKFRLLIFSTVYVLSSTVASSQSTEENQWPACQKNDRSTIQQLFLNKPISRSTSTGPYHQYRLNLRDNSFVVVKVDQRGIDVAIRICDEQGNQIGEPYDTPNGKKEPEEVYWVTK